MQTCLYCQSPVEASEYTCTGCGLGYRGHFPRSRLARLDAADQRLVERLVLTGGNLKELERLLEVSYPTVRKRVGALRDRLEQLRENDQLQIDAWLGEVERGELAAAKAARYIEALNGGD